MAFLRRELYRQVKGPEITHEDRCSLVFDTDTKSLYVEREVAHLETGIAGTDYRDRLCAGGRRHRTRRQLIPDTGRFERIVDVEPPPPRIEPSGLL